MGFSMTSYSPRYYQKEALINAAEYISSGGKAGLAVLPTGTGKSHIIAELIQKLFIHNNKFKILMVTHVKELIEQNFEKLKLHWEKPAGRPPAGINSAGLGSRQFTQPIIYAGIQSVYKESKRFGSVTVLLIDECHLLSDKSTGMYRTFIRGLKLQNPDLCIIGFTATPFRMDMGHLCTGDTFDKVFYDISNGKDFTKLISEGFLSNLKGIQPKQQLDLSKVEKTKNDFKEASLDKYVNRAEITKKIVAETIQWAKDRKKGLAFCVSKSHAEDMSSRFNQAGLKSTFIHSDLSADLRAKRLADYKNGLYSLITNVGVLTTGFDAPDIDYILMARPTRSPSLHIQMLGRGMRPYQGKNDCLVLDYGGNIKRLGFVNDVSLPEQNATGSDVAKVKSCKHCSALIPISAKICTFCEKPIESKPKQISPNKNVHRGKVINSKTTKTAIIKQNKAQTIKVLPQHLKVSVSFETANSTIFFINQENDNINEKMAILFLRHGSTVQASNKKIRVLGVSATEIAEALTQNKHTKIGKLKNFVSSVWKETQFKLIKHDDKVWAPMWPKLTQLSGKTLWKLFTAYAIYLSKTREKNEQINTRRTEASDRFLKHVFFHKQAHCPFDQNQSGCFFEEKKSKKWLCLSCGKLKSRELTLSQFRQLHPYNSLIPISEFIEHNLKPKKLQ